MKGFALDARRWTLVLAVALATLLGGVLRFYGLGTPSLWLDEILHYDVATHAARLPWHSWALGFEFENGPLLYGSLLAGRVVDDPAASDRLAAALAGTAAIPLVAVAGALAGGATAGVAAAWLLAAAPFHVFYSREGRPYALLALASALMLIALLARGRRLPVRLGWGVALAAPYLAVSSFQLLAGTLLAAAACGLVARRKATGGTASPTAAPTPRPDWPRRRWLQLMAAAASGLVVLVLLYGHYPRGPQLGTFPAAHGKLALFVLNALAASPLWRLPISPLAGVFAAAALAGVVDLLRRRRHLQAVALGVFAAGIAAATWAGMAIPDHFFTLRYFTPVLPPYLVLTALGLTAAARAIAWATGRLQGAPVGRAFVPALVAAATLTLVACNLPTAIRCPYQKADWRAAARAIVLDAGGRPGTVLAANNWTATCLRFYLRPYPRLRVRQIDGPPAALVTAAAPHGCWLAHGGYPQRPMLKRWARQYPALWHGKEESVTVFRCGGPAGPGTTEPPPKN